MMEQPGANFAIPTSEEEELKKQIAKAYMQDKDVDVAVLEEKLRKRAQWRKEVLAQRKMSSNVNTEDEDGWWVVKVVQSHYDEEIYCKHESKNIENVL